MERLERLRLVILFVLVLMLTLTVVGLMMNKTTAAAPRRNNKTICRGDVGQTASDAAKPKIYASRFYTDSKIDYDATDEEYVFEFEFADAPDLTQLRWYTDDAGIRTLTNFRWKGRLGVADACTTKLLIYVDTLAVNLSGGAKHWQEQLWLWQP